MYQLHPCHALREQFERKPFQGADPFTSRFLFVGLDANYAEGIEASDVFAQLQSYHEDGPRFWRQTGVHHPFLLPRYRGDGQRYHRTFAKIGFQPKHADLVSFVELLHLPTFGRSYLEGCDLNTAHLRRIRRAIFEGAAEFVFISAGVQRLMVSTGQFPELESVQRTFGALRVLHEGSDRAVFLHLHFSNYGKFEKQLQAEAVEIAGLIGYGDA